MDSRLRHPVLRGRRRHQPLPARADRLPHAAGAAVLMEVGEPQGEGVLRVPARARERDARRLRLARPVPLLHLLGRDARPDVLPDRHLGLRPAHLRGRQVHPLHGGRQRPHAAGHHRPGLAAQLDYRHRLQLRPAEALRPAHPAAVRVLVLPGLHAGVRHQGAVVPVPHVAARRARRGADGRLGHPGWRAAEDGNLRPGALRLPAVPRGRDLVRPLPRGARRRGHHLRRAGRDGAAGPEETGGLLERQPPGLRRARHLRAEPAGAAGLDLPDAEPRHHHRRRSSSSWGCCRTGATRGRSRRSAASRR